MVFFSGIINIFFLSAAVAAIIKLRTNQSAGENRETGLYTLIGIISFFFFFSIKKTADRAAGRGLPEKPLTKLYVKK
jgi:hypothetical protein